MKAEELKTKTADELKKLLLELKKKQFNLRFQQSQGQLANTAEIRVTRRTIARVKTFLDAQGEGVTPSPAKKKAKETKKPAAKKAPAKKTTKKAAKAAA